MRFGELKERGDEKPPDESKVYKEPSHIFFCPGELPGVWFTQNIVVWKRTRNTSESFSAARFTQNIVVWKRSCSSNLSRLLYIRLRRTLLFGNGSPGQVSIPERRVLVYAEHCCLETLTSSPKVCPSSF